MAVVSGGTTLIDNGALDAGVPTGSLILLSTQTASASATIDFTSRIDSTYDSYVFKFINIHPATDSVEFSFQVNAVGGSGYNETITSTAFDAYHKEDDSTAGIEYDTNRDKAQGTSFQALNSGLDNDNDSSMSGYLQLFNPSSTTFVKHFMSSTNTYYDEGWSLDWKMNGYINTTSAIDEIQFKMSSGNIDSGTIKMYGVK